MSCVDVILCLFFLLPVYVCPCTCVFYAIVNVGLLENVCKLLAKNFASLPGDKRRQIVIITYGRGIGFYAFKVLDTWGCYHGALL